MYVEDNSMTNFSLQIVKPDVLAYKPKKAAANGEPKKAAANGEPTKVAVNGDVEKILEFF